MKVLLAVLMASVLGCSACLGQSLFSDDFSGDLSKWTISEPSCWSAVDGCLRADVYDAKLSKILAGDPGWSDYRIDLDVVQFSGVDKFCYFRYQGETVGYFVNFRGPVPEEDNDPGAVRLFRLNNNHQWSWGSWDLVDSAFFPNAPGTTYHLAIEAIGSRITVFVGGIEVLSYVDSSSLVLTGRVGLGGFNGATGGPCRVNWDNFSVTIPAVATRATTWGRLKGLYD